VAFRSDEDTFETLTRGKTARCIGGKKTVEEILANSSDLDIRAVLVAVRSWLRDKCRPVLPP